LHKQATTTTTTTTTTIITYVMELGHLLTRSGLTYPEVSSKVCHDSFCQLGNSVSLPWAIYYEVVYLHVVSSFSYTTVTSPKWVFRTVFYVYHQELKTAYTATVYVKQLLLSASIGDEMELEFQLFFQRFRMTIMKITNKRQLYRLIYYSYSALHVSGDIFAHHQEHLTVFTVHG
jgi:hypothetical protein